MFLRVKPAVSSGLKISLFTKHQFVVVQQQKSSILATKGIQYSTSRTSPCYGPLDRHEKSKVSLLLHSAKLLKTGTNLRPICRGLTSKDSKQTPSLQQQQQLVDYDELKTNEDDPTTAPGDQRTGSAPTLDCDRSDVIFANRTNVQLLRALFAMQCCSHDILVKNSMKVR